MKRRKLWKMGEDGLYRSSSAIQTRLGPSSLLEAQSVTPIVLCFLCVVGYPPLPNRGKRPRYIDILSRATNGKQQSRLKGNRKGIIVKRQRILR